MTAKVVTPALTSVARFVPRSANLKYDAIASTGCGPPFPPARRPRVGPVCALRGPSTPDAPPARLPDGSARRTPGITDLAGPDCRDRPAGRQPAGALEGWLDRERHPSAPSHP